MKHNLQKNIHVFPVGWATLIAAILFLGLILTLPSAQAQTKGSLTSRDTSKQTSQNTSGSTSGATYTTPGVSTPGVSTTGTGSGTATGSGTSNQTASGTGTSQEKICMDNTGATYPAESLGCIIYSEGSVDNSTAALPTLVYESESVHNMACHDINGVKRAAALRLPYAKDVVFITNQDGKTTMVLFNGTAKVHAVENDDNDNPVVTEYTLQNAVNPVYAINTGDGVVIVDKDGGQILMADGSTSGSMLLTTVVLSGLDQPRLIGKSSTGYVYIVTRTEILKYDEKITQVGKFDIAASLGLESGKVNVLDGSINDSTLYFSVYNEVDPTNGMIAMMDTGKDIISPAVTGLHAPAAVIGDDNKHLFVGNYDTNEVIMYDFDPATLSLPVAASTLTKKVFASGTAKPLRIRVAEDVCVTETLKTVDLAECVPFKEECDGKDNDCDDAVDEGGVCDTEGSCLDQLTPSSEPCTMETAARTCTTAGTTAAVGISGVQVCKDGFWSECSNCGDQCNGINDDKDKDTDEDAPNIICYTGPDGTEGVGICHGGKAMCENGSYDNCKDEQTPVDEICGNNLDDDCDGQTDEGCATVTQTVTDTKTATSTGTGSNTNTNTGTGSATSTQTSCAGLYTDGCQTGEMEHCSMADGSDGTHMCISGTWGCCVYTQDPCDGVDNDLDGRIDEDGGSRDCYQWQSETNGVGQCHGGTQTCIEGGKLIQGTKMYQANWSECTDQMLPNPAGEVCNGHTDDDCDGATDEGCECTEGEQRQCGEDEGQCAFGTQTCYKGKWGACENGFGPGDEVCDGVDNNCNGQVDEDATGQIISETCYDGPGGTSGIGLCKSGVSKCELTVVASTTAGVYTMSACEGQILPVTETCNGLDDDCDGVIDPGCDCTDGETESCGLDEGECVAGSRTCSNGKWGACQNQVDPIAEICDGKDNDCDGYTDEGDDNQPMTEDYYDGAKGTENVGVCHHGSQTCTDGKWQVTSSSVIPGDEACDSVDNDCDGTTDEGCNCQDGSTQDCGSDIGACAFGKQTCYKGNWSSCQDAVGKGDESCNGVDDDCDGSTDEDLSQDCYTGADGTLDEGICHKGTQTCGVDTSVPGVTTAGWGSCMGEQTPMTETCDGVDNDCDGDTDEGCDCTDGATQSCGDDTGECTQGAQTCADGKWGECTGDTGVSDEICDGLDNDCDGEVDEGLTQKCYEGADGTENKGLCTGGTSTCTQGQWGSCKDQIVPATETYDDEDNDCDGSVDEGFDCEPGTTMSCGSDTGECVAGTQTCSEDGKWGECENSTSAQTESCNGKDDDCDGTIDPGCACTDGATQSCGDDTGACVAGTQTCTQGQWAACTGSVSGTDEACDGIDNDCDGSVDEELVMSCYTGADGTQGVGLCTGGSSTCSNGQWSSCSGEVVPETSDTCSDSKDNDCDGTVDEGCVECEEGAIQYCGTDEGECQMGTQDCVNGTWSETCTDEKTGSVELCDGLDNDCDGDVDEEFQLGETCTDGTGACQATGQVVCASDGLGTTCNAKAGDPIPAEICTNQIDDDCNGAVNDNCEYTPGELAAPDDTSNAVDGGADPSSGLSDGEADGDGSGDPPIDDPGVGRNYISGGGFCALRAPIFVAQPEAGDIILWLIAPLVFIILRRVRRETHSV